MFDSDRQDLYMGLEVGGYSLFAYTSGYVGRIVLRLVFREPPREHSWTVHGLSCSELFLVSLGHGLLWRSWWVVYVGEGTDSGLWTIAVSRIGQVLGLVPE